MNALSWAGDAGFKWVVAVGERARRRRQLREAVRALDLGLTISFRNRVEIPSGELAPGDLWVEGVTFGCLPGSRDLKLLARGVGDMVRGGMHPVIVGPEFNTGVRRHPELLRYLMQAGCSCCALASSFTGARGNGARVTALRIASLGYYAYIGGYLDGRVMPAEAEMHLQGIPPGWRRTQSDVSRTTMMRARALARRMEEECEGGHYGCKD